MSTTENTQGKVEVFETVLKPLTDQKDGKIYCAFCGCFLGTKEGYHFIKGDRQNCLIFRTPGID